MKPLRVAVQFTLDCRRRCVVKLGLHWLCVVPYSMATAAEMKSTLVLTGDLIYFVM